MFFHKASEDSLDCFLDVHVTDFGLREGFRELVLRHRNTRLVVRRIVLCGFLVGCFLLFWRSFRGNETVQPQDLPEIVPKAILPPHFHAHGQKVVLVNGRVRDQTFEFFFGVTWRQKIFRDLLYLLLVAAKEVDEARLLATHFGKTFVVLNATRCRGVSMTHHVPALQKRRLLHKLRLSDDVVEDEPVLWDFVCFSSSGEFLFL